MSKDYCTQCGTELTKVNHWAMYDLCHGCVRKNSKQREANTPRQATSIAEAIDVQGERPRVVLEVKCGHVPAPDGSRSELYGKSVVCIFSHCVSIQNLPGGMGVGEVLGAIFMHAIGGLFGSIIWSMRDRGEGRKLFYEADPRKNVAAYDPLRQAVAVEVGEETWVTFRVSKSSPVGFDGLCRALGECYGSRVASTRFPQLDNDVKRIFKGIAFILVMLAVLAMIFVLHEWCFR